MSAEVLRQAAALMRARLEAARAGRWETAESALNPDARLVVANWRGGPVRVATCSGSLPEGNAINAEHIASWHPAVALAVAELLDEQAVHYEREADRYGWTLLHGWAQANDDTPPSAEFQAHIDKVSAEFAAGACRQALAVARAYLGTQP